MTLNVSPESAAAELSKYGPAVVLSGTTYRDQSIAFLMPTRGEIPAQVMQHCLALARPMNHRCGWFLIKGEEVGAAYNAGMREVLANESLSKMAYVMTIEDDNLVPAAGPLLLMQAMEQGGFDAVSGLYHMKGPLQVPMAFGHPDQRDPNGDLDMSPRDLTDSILAGEVVEVNGIACGCALWKLDIFRKMEPPWFKTFTRIHCEGVVEMMTQDLYFCRAAREAGYRLAVDTRVKVGHMDRVTGEVY